MDLICLDFETEAIDGNTTTNPPRPVGLAVDWPGRERRYYAWGHPTGNNCIETDGARLLHEAWESGRALLFHNAKFDLAVAMKWFGLPMPDWTRIHDTLFLLFLDNPHARSLSLKPAAEQYLNWPPDEQDAVADWLRAHKIITKTQRPGAFISKCDGAVVGEYALGDTDRTGALFERLYPKLDEGMRAAYDRERKLLPILMANEARGMRVDVPRLSADIMTLRAGIRSADLWLRKTLGVGDLNLDADADVADALRRGGIVTEFEKTATGRDSTSKKTLTADKFSDPRIWQVLGYRNRAQTLLSMSMEPWLLDAQQSGRIHTEWNQVRSGHGNEWGGTRTGRLSCSRFQNIAKSFDGRPDGWAQPTWLVPTPLPLVRDYILPEEGETWLHRDYSQQEFRIVAHYADGDILRAYQDNPHVDFHTAMQERLRGIGMVVDRPTVKGISFGILYGMGLARLAEHLKISEATAKALRTAARQAMPDVLALDAELKSRARYGEPLRTWGGRLYHCEQADDGRDLSYKMLNVLVQGSAADCTKEALVRLADAGWGGGSLLVTIHDEINLSAKSVKKTDKVLREVMEGIEFDVKMLTEKKIGPTWGQLTKETK